MTELRSPGAVRINCPVIDCDGWHSPNIPLLRKVYEHIANNPSDWNQGVWGKKMLKAVDALLPRDQKGRFIKSKPSACHTEFCFAGHAVNFSGIPFREDALYEGSHGKTIVWDLSTTAEMDRFGAQISVPDMAVHLLGLTEEEGTHSLFSGGNNLQSVRRCCEAIAERAGEKFDV